MKILLKRFYEGVQAKALLIFCLLMGLVFYSSTPKTPNFGLMGAYLPPNFPDITTGMSILRVWTYLEKIEYSLLKGFYFSNNFLYGLCAGYLVYVICERAIRKQTVARLLLVLPGFLIALYYASFGGPLFDITFALALVMSMYYTIDVGKDITGKQVLKLAFWVTLLYMSRPFGMYFAILIYGFFLVKIGKRILPACLLTLLVMMPFHLNQLNKFGTFTLSTYSGTNLVEALQSAGENQNQFLDCKVILGRQMYDTKEMVDCSKQNGVLALAMYQNKPEVFAKLFNVKRVLGTFMFPEPFWYATGFTQEQRSQVQYQVISIVYYLSLFFAYLMVLTNFRKAVGFILPTVGFIMGIVLPVMGTDGSEAIRIVMPFVALLYWMVTTKNIPEPLTVK